MTIRNEILALENLSTAELAAEFERLHGRPPRYRQPAWMKKRCAYKLQENACGGLPSVARAELDRLAADLKLPTAPPSRRDADDDARGPQGRPRPGTVLVREWHGREIRVEVTRTGFVFEGEEFRSLSAVAKRATGQHWNGRLFFNLVERTTKK